MKIKAMKGSRREILLAALTSFLKATKDAERKCEAAFLPTLEADVQVERIEEAAKTVPLVDAVAREWEAAEPLIFVCRNACVVHGRAIDKVMRDEKALTISTTDSEALLEEVQEIMVELGDERDLQAVLRTARNSEAVENKKDPRQMELAPVDGGEPKTSYADILKAGRANATAKATGERKVPVGRPGKGRREE